MQFKDTTVFHLIIAGCFIASTVMAMVGAWYEAFHLGTIIMALYMVLGSLKKGKLDIVFFLFIVGTFVISWTIAFCMAQHYAVLFDNRPPDFTILGLHPSFFWIFMLYFTYPVLVFSVGFFIVRDRWLSSAEWDAFRQNIAVLNKKGGQS